MPPISVLIKPASSLCNLACEYCFYHAIAENREVASYGIMKEETLEEIVRKVLDFADVIASFSFQGGEPTLAGLDFFRRLIELEKKYNTKGVQIENCLQTNGTLLDEEWCRFLHEHHEIWRRTPVTSVTGGAAFLLCVNGIFSSCEN